MSLLLIFFIFLSSIIASIMGIGGGILFTPIQVLFSIPIKNAVSTSLFLIMITSLSSTITYIRKKRVNFLLLLMIEIPTAIGAITGGLISKKLNENLHYLILIIAMIISSIFLIEPLTEKRNVCMKKSRIKFLNYKIKINSRNYTYNIFCVFIIMFIVGTIISLIGISGGIIKIPIMISLFGIPIEIAIGTSALMIGITSISGIIGHILAGNFVVKNSLILIIPVFLGAQLGSCFSVRIKSNKLKKVYRYLLMIIAFFMLARLFIINFQ